MPISDETLMAYADGELDADAARQVEEALATDERLATKLAAFADSRRAVKAAFAEPAEVPADLADRVRGLAAEDAARRAAAAPTNVVDLASRRRPAPAWQLPLAASIALAVGAAAGWIAAPGGNGASGISLAGLGDRGLGDALARVASGERAELPGGGSLAAIATFRDGDGVLCREFEYDRDAATTFVAVACRDETDWDLRLVVAAPAADSSGYAPASSLDTLEAFLAASGAGPALSAEEERGALDALR